MNNENLITEESVLEMLKELEVSSKEIKIFRKRMKNEGVGAVIPALIALEEKRLKREEEELRIMEAQKEKAEDELKNVMQKSVADFDKKFDQQFDKVFSEIEAYDEKIKKMEEEEGAELDQINEETIAKIKGLVEKEI